MPVPYTVESALSFGQARIPQASESVGLSTLVPMKPEVQHPTDWKWGGPTLCGVKMSLRGCVNLKMF